MVKTKTSSSFKSFLKSSELGKSILTFILIYLFSILASPRQFLSVYNQRSLLLQASPWMIAALGESLAILMGSIDLSAGSTIAFSSMISALVLMKTGSLGIAVLAGILAGSAVGLANGVMVAKLKLFSFVATLASLVAVRGLVLGISRGVTYTNLTQYAPIASTVAGIPVPFLFAVGVGLFMYIFLKRTTIGRFIYAIGGNEEAVRFSGINADRVKIIAFTIGGTTYGIAGVLFNSILLAAYPWLANGGELTAIASCVLGGIQLTGGIGHPIGPMLGAYIMTLITNILVILGFSADWQYVVTGIVLVLAATVLGRGLKYVK